MAMLQVVYRTLVGTRKSHMSCDWNATSASGADAKFCFAHSHPGLIHSRGCYASILDHLFKSHHKLVYFCLKNCCLISLMLSLMNWRAVSFPESMLSGLADTFWSAFASITIANRLAHNILARQKAYLCWWLQYNICRLWWLSPVWMKCKLSLMRLRIHKDLLRSDHCRDLCVMQVRQYAWAPYLVVASELPLYVFCMYSVLSNLFSRNSSKDCINFVVLRKSWNSDLWGLVKTVTSIHGFKELSELDNVSLWLNFSPAGMGYLQQYCFTQQGTHKYCTCLQARSTSWWRGDTKQHSPGWFTHSISIYYIF